MEILNQERNLRDVLEKCNSDELILVSAFASNTESIIEKLLKNRKKVTLIIGTINYFSSPDFIEYCAKLSEEYRDFKFYVDFRINKSIHWKLYLIAPTQLIIGSPNLTGIGVSLERDTCISVETKPLFTEYRKKINNLLEIPRVISSTDKSFKSEFEEYKLRHRHFQSAITRTVESNTIEEWLSDEYNHMIPLFIWEGRLSKEEKEKSSDIFEEIEKDKPSRLRDSFNCECKKGEISYQEGDTVLCLNDKGNQPDFYTFDYIVYEDDRYWIYSLKRPRYHRPFKVTDELKKKIKKRVANWVKDELESLNRKELKALADVKVR